MEFSGTLEEAFTKPGILEYLHGENAWTMENESDFLQKYGWRFYKMISPDEILKSFILSRISLPLLLPKTNYKYISGLRR